MIRISIYTEIITNKISRFFCEAMCLIIDVYISKISAQDDLHGSPYSDSFFFFFLRLNHDTVSCC